MARELDYMGNDPESTNPEANGNRSAVPAGHDKKPVSNQSHYGLDWFAFFVADIQTGWGPFVAVYLTAIGWAQLDIGLVLTTGTLAAFALQIPAGAVVDSVEAKRSLAAFAVLCISGSALMLALWPSFSMVIAAKLLHAIASCLLGPAMAAISLGLVGHAGLSVRLGRNARFLSLGNALAAAAMGGLGYTVSNRAIFFFTAALSIPALISLFQIRSAEIDPDLARGAAPQSRGRIGKDAIRSLIGNKALLIFAGAVFLFQLANAAALPIVAGQLAVHSPDIATIILSICIFGPQFVVVAIAPWIGRLAQSWGRRPLLCLCFAALAIRCGLFALSTNPLLVIAVQLLDGISAATLGILVPLVLADVMRGTGHYNLAQGAVGAAVGIGASLSTAAAGYVADHFTISTAFVFLAIVAASGFLLAVGLMPETRVRAPENTPPTGR